MKTNWEVLNDYVIRGDKEKTCDWLRKFKKYPHTPVKDYLEMEETARKLAEYPEVYAVSVEELKKALFGDFKKVE